MTNKKAVKEDILNIEISASDVCRINKEKIRELLSDSFDFDCPSVMGKELFEDVLKAIAESGAG